MKIGNKNKKRRLCGDVMELTLKHTLNMAWIVVLSEFRVSLSQLPPYTWLGAHLLLYTQLVTGHCLQPSFLLLIQSLILRPYSFIENKWHCGRKRVCTPRSCDLCALLVTLQCCLTGRPAQKHRDLISHIILSLTNGFKSNHGFVVYNLKTAPANKVIGLH